VKTPILGSSYVARSVNAADSRMVNLFPEMVPDGGKEPAFLQRAPGLRLVGYVGDGPIRGLWKFGDFLYVASGGKLYRVDANFAATELGLINGSGPVSMSDNGVQLFVACNPDAFIYNAGTGAFAQITDPDFPGAVTVGYLDGYFVFNEPNSQRFWVTSLNDGTAVDPLDFASAEANPDDIVSLMVSHREVWLFGNNSIEVWYNAGLADFPLARIQGAVLEFGCQAPYSVAKMDNSLFWLGADARGSGIVYRSNGYNAQRISTHAVEWQIQQYAVTNDAIAYTYQQDGHSFYVLTFPTAQATWVFDVSTGAWHERAYWDGVAFRRHRSNCQANFAGQIIVGDWENQKLYAFDPQVYDDNNNTQRWLRSWRALPTGQNTLKRTAQHSLQLDCESGTVVPTIPINWREITNGSLTGGVAYGLLRAAVFIEPERTLFNRVFNGRKLGDIDNNGLVNVNDANDINIYAQGGFLPANKLQYIEGPMSDILRLYPADYAAYLYPPTPTDPQVMLRWSDDGGHTWSNEHWASTGKVGEYGKRVIWRRLGMTTKLRDRVYEISGADPVKIAIMGAELIASPTRA